MLDGVSLAASVVTLTGFVSKIIKYAEHLWHAPEELKAVRVRGIAYKSCNLSV